MKKNNKKDNEAANRRRSFTKQFYHGNIRYLIPAALSGVLVAGINLLISWLMQRILDVASIEKKFPKRMNPL